MSIGASTAVAIGLGAASVGTQLVGAKLQSSAAKNAAKTQSQSVDQALAAQRYALDQQLPIYQQVYQDQRAGMEPYAQAGRNAMGTLGRLMTPGQPYTPDLQAQDAQMNAARPTSWAPMPMPSMPGMDPLPPEMGGPPPMGGLMEAGGPRGPADAYEAMLMEQAQGGYPQSRIAGEQQWDPRRPSLSFLAQRRQ